MDLPAVFTDIQPIPQEDGPDSLASIAYPQVYADSMAYLRALLALDEHSVRALELTGQIIAFNSSHYTIWLYRASILNHMGDRELEQRRQGKLLAPDEISFLDYLCKEIQWLNEISLKSLKNYQIWHHRQTIITRLAKDDPSFHGEGEIEFLAKMLAADAKNYHVWSYRQWMVRHFAMWDSAQEWAELERFITEDVRNNSAWNHRFFLSFARYDKETNTPTEELAPGDKEDLDERVQSECAYAKRAILLAVNNPSPWNYIKGILRRYSQDLSAIRGFCEELSPIEDVGRIRSSPALECLGEIYSADQSKEKEAAKVYELLSERFDPIRKPYWRWRSSRLGNRTADVSVH